MKGEIDILAPNAPPPPALVPGSPHSDGPGLPLSAHGSNISPKKPVIW